MSLLTTCGTVGLAAVVLSVGGCVARPSGPDTPTMRAIEDATHIIDYPSQRLMILKGLASQADLQPHEQIYLVNAIFMGGFSRDVADALVALLQNPGCTQETRQHIRSRLKLARLLGPDQRRVLEALGEVKPAPSGPNPSVSSNRPVYDD